LISAAQIDSMRRQCLNDFESEAIWEAIYDAYKQSHRHYHTLMHIASMLAIFRRTGPLRYGVAVNFAIWFHDFVYETGSSSYPENESRSADAMVRLLRQYRPDLFASAAEVPRDVALAEAMILSTKKHQPIESFDTTWADAVVDCHVFLDIDLSILAKSEEVVLLFDDGIKKEFSQYPDDQFAAGRVQALSSFLLRDRVFYSKNFAGLEALARSNLNMLIARWSARKESK
jgi:predicted metal-dependent HD superfamily phosphohydrolase